MVWKFLLETDRKTIMNNTVKENEKVLKFAQRSGYDSVEYLGKYKEFDLYKPLYENPDMATGLPVYIIVKDNKPKYVRGVAGREIQKYRENVIL